MNRAEDLRLRFPNASTSFLRLHGLSPGKAKEPVSPPTPMPDTPQPLKSPPSAPVSPKKGRLRQKGTLLNKTETAFLAWITDQGGENYGPTLSQAITLRIANGCRYTPDFIRVWRYEVKHEITAHSILAYEVKGFMRDDAAVKLKVAASLYPWIKFHLVTKKKGSWLIQEILP